MGCLHSKADINTNSVKIVSIPDLLKGTPSAVSSLSQPSCCRHPYLNKWEGKYICIDCNYSLSSTHDTVRIKIEEEKEAKTPSDKIPDGMSIGKMSQQRGVSIGFLLSFTRKYSCWDKSSWWIIRNIIKPATEDVRCRFVELDEMAEHIGPAQTFISYAQAGNWGDLVAAILDGGADYNRKVWIDIFAVRQWPSDNPDLDFASTIENCESFLCVCSSVESIKDAEWKDVLARKTADIPQSDRKKIAFLRVWCLVEIAAATKKKDMPIIMKCGSYVINESIRFDSRWEQLDKLAYFIDIKNAEATVESDKNRILSDIQGSLTIDYLNSIIRGVLLAAKNITWAGELGSIVQCAACGDSEAIQYVLSTPSNSIVAVASGGYIELLKILLARGGDVNSSDKNGESALMRASANGRISCVELLLASGADVNARTSYGWVALMFACKNGHQSCIEHLLLRGAELNAQDPDGGTSLMWASENGHASCIQILLKNGADVDLVGLHDRNAFTYASENGHASCVQLLVEATSADNKFQIPIYDKM